MKVKLTRIYRKEVDTKNGKATKVGIKTEQHGDVWINGWENSAVKNWKEGDEVEVEIWNDEKWGKQFKTQSLTVNRNEFNLLVARVEKLEKMMSIKESNEFPVGATNNEDKEVDGLPF